MGLSYSSLATAGMHRGMVEPPDLASFESRVGVGTRAAPGPLVLLGAPGVGKGTQGDLLAAIWRIPKISTGDILRANVAEGTPLGVEAAETMRCGGLVPDDVMEGMVASRIAGPDAACGFILDGFPRTARQAEWLDDHLAGQRRFGPLTVINLTMEPERIIERIIHRRVCPQCKSVYNTRLQPPLQEGKCDRDGAVLEQRNDDSLEVFQDRLDAFRRETEPLIKHYQKHPTFMRVDADRPSQAVTKDIVELIELRVWLDQRS